jgi:hypothetical protein
MSIPGRICVQMIASASYSSSFASSFGDKIEWNARIGEFLS